MSRRNSKSGKEKQAPKATGTNGPDIYVGLLFVSVAALTFGCVLLVLELNKYGWALPT